MRANLMTAERSSTGREDGAALWVTFLTKLRYEGHRPKQTRRRDHGRPSPPHARHPGNAQDAKFNLAAQGEILSGRSSSDRAHIFFCFQRTTPDLEKSTGVKQGASRSYSLPQTRS